MLVQFSLAAARSCLPSRSKSSTITCCGLPPNGELAALPKVPSPTPVRSESVPELFALTVARSGLLSRLKSPITTESGPDATV